MTTKLFVNLPVKDLGRSKEFFARLGFTFFGHGDDMASIVISDYTQVMLLTQEAFVSYTGKPIADQTEVILVLGLDNPTLVDELADAALAAGAGPAGVPKAEGGVYQRGFADLDGHHWEALCLTG